jgi:hypothetical protein
MNIENDGTEWTREPTKDYHWKQNKLWFENDNRILIKELIKPNVNPIEIFEIFFSNEKIQNWCDWTNKYYLDCQAKNISPVRKKNAQMH